MSDTLFSCHFSNVQLQQCTNVSFRLRKTTVASDIYYILYYTVDNALVVIH